MGETWSEKFKKWAEGDPDVYASGVIQSPATRLTIYKDGTFVVKGGFNHSTRDRLVSIDYDADSIRRKSASGRGAAALATGGFSLIAANNRGVVDMTVVGEATGVRTFRTRNPDGHILDSFRTLKAAGDAVRGQAGVAATRSETNVAEQLKALVDLHASGALSDAEFQAAKARLLG